MKRQPRLTRNEQRARDAAKLPSDGVLVSCEAAPDGYYVVFTKPTGEPWHRIGPFPSREAARAGVEEMARQGGMQVYDSIKDAYKRN